MEYTISALDAIINGPTSNRYIDRVNVYLINGNGVTLHYGTFNGTQQNNVNVVLQGPVQSVWVTLEDGYDGNSAVQQNVAFSTVLYCNGEPQLPPGSNNIAANAIQADGLENEDISLFPNPAQDVLHVSLPDIDGEITLWIQDQLGNNIWSENVNGLRSTMAIDLNENKFQNGIYYLVCRSNGGLTTKRFIISK